MVDKKASRTGRGQDRCKHRVSMVVPDWLWDEICRRAEADHTTPSAIMRRCLFSNFGERR